MYCIAKFYDVKTSKELKHFNFIKTDINSQNDIIKFEDKSIYYLQDALVKMNAYVKFYYYTNYELFFNEMMDIVNEEYVEED